MQPFDDGDCKRRTFDISDGDESIQVSYNDKTHFLYVVVFGKDKTCNYRPILKTKKKLRSAIQLFSKNANLSVIEVDPLCHHINIPRVKK